MENAAKDYATILWQKLFKEALEFCIDKTKTSANNSDLYSKFSAELAQLTVQIALADYQKQMLIANRQRSHPKY